MLDVKYSVEDNRVAEVPKVERGYAMHHQMLSSVNHRRHDEVSFESELSVTCSDFMQAGNRFKRICRTMIVGTKLQGGVYCMPKNKEPWGKTFARLGKNGSGGKRQAKRHAFAPVAQQPTGNGAKPAKKGLPSWMDGPTPSKPVHATGAPAKLPKFIQGQPFLFISRTWQVADERQQIMDLLKSLTDDILDLRDEPGTYPSWYSIYVKTLTTGKGPKPLGTELLRLLQDPIGKVILIPGTSVLPGGAKNKNSNNEVNFDLQLTKGPNLFTRPFSMALSDPSGTKVQECKLLIVVAHEFVHCTHFLRAGGNGGFSPDSFYDEYKNQFNENQSKEEMITVGLGAYASERLCENSIRKEQGLDARICYASPDLVMDKQGVTYTGAEPHWWPNYPINGRNILIKLVSLTVIDDEHWIIPGEDWDIEFKLDTVSVSKESQKAVKTGDVFSLGWNKTIFVWDGRMTIPIDIKAGKTNKEDIIHTEFVKPNWGEGTQSLSSKKGLFKVELSITRQP